MKKKTDNKMGRVLGILAIASFIITLLEGIIFYGAETYADPIFKWMLIAQNSIKAFGFKSDIGLKDVSQMLQDNPNEIEVAIGYAYTLAIFVAPYCTLTIMYKMVERWLRVKSWKWFSRKERCIIFGYNDEVKALLQERKEDRDTSSKDGKAGDYCKNYRIHIVSPDVDKDEEMQLLQRRIVVHKVDFLRLSEEQLEYFFKQIEVKKAKKIILFEQSSAKNFSLYQMFHNELWKKTYVNQDVKFFCRCEEEGIRRVIEDYHDTPIRKKKATKDKEAADAIKVYKDLELISIPELRVRKLLKENALHKYYIDKKVEDRHQWKLHLLIIGFGKLGQQLALQAMSHGVVSSKAPILIDVIDYNIDEKKNIFANNFSDQYAEIGEDSISIPGEKADGDLTIRFHKMDIRYQQFHKLLSEYGDINKDGIYTYVAICVKDADVSMHCMSVVERYLRDCGEADCQKYVNVAIRMECDKQMALYLNENNETYKNVFVIKESEDTISLMDLLHDKVDEDAKEFNRIYNSISIKSNSKDGKEAEAAGEADAKVEGEEALRTKRNELWSQLELFRRNSNRALAYHQDVKEIALKQLYSGKLTQLFVDNESILKQKGNSWVYDCSPEEFVKKQSDQKAYPVVSEMSRLEHRRWCYFMASCGWRRTLNPKADKNDEQRENPCLCTWEELVENKMDTCSYDLMPMLLLVEEEQRASKRQGKK